MPVARLLVEGRLDAELLQPIFAGRPTVERGGSKYSLAPQCRSERRRTGGNDIGYLRDRDFDYEPPDELTQPIVDQTDGESILGWRWGRHEIENYLIDPALVSAARDWDEDEYGQALIDAAQRLRYYQAARWVIGTARRNLPPRYELRTSPEETSHSEFRLPSDLGETASFVWAKTDTAEFRKKASQKLRADSVRSSFQRRCRQLTDDFLGTLPNRSSGVRVRTCWPRWNPGWYSTEWTRPELFARSCATGFDSIRMRRSTCYLNGRRSSSDYAHDSAAFRKGGKRRTRTPRLGLSRNKVAVGEPAAGSLPF